MRATISFPTTSSNLIATFQLGKYWANFLAVLKQIPLSLKSRFYQLFSYSFPVSYDQPSIRTPRLRISLSRFRQNHRRLFFGILLAIVIFIVGSLLFMLAKFGGSASLGTTKVNIDQTYQIMARDQNGKATGQAVTFRLTSAEKATSVLIQGKRANVRNNKLFLLINFEIDNPDSTVYFINPTDLVRYVRSDGKKFAPTVYQGVLQVRPASTKSSNIGFVIDQNDKVFNMEVGDIDSYQQPLEIKF